MTVILQVTTLVIATMFAAAAAVAFDWLLLRAAFHLMRPATARRVPVRSLTAQGKAELVRGTMLLARAFDPRR
jgi:hypothetical protein